MSTPVCDPAPRHALGAPRPGRTVRLAFALSLLLHAALFWQWRQALLTPSLDSARVGGQSALHLRLAPPPEPASTADRARSARVPRPASPAQETTGRRKHAALAPEARPALPPAENVLVAPPPAQSITPAAITPPGLPAAPAAGVALGDLSAFIAARRRSRGESASPPAPARDDDTRREQRIAENLGLNARQSFGYDPRRGGGVFQVQTLEFDYAEFIFFGWSKGIRRNAKLLIEVRRGAQPDIRIAVVRRMIEIIRDNEKENFVWQSARLGHNVTLSARQQDNAELESFLLREFFDPSTGPR